MPERGRWWTVSSRKCANAQRLEGEWSEDAARSAIQSLDSWPDRLQSRDWEIPVTPETSRGNLASPAVSEGSSARAVENPRTDSLLRGRRRHQRDPDALRARYDRAEALPHASCFRQNAGRRPALRQPASDARRNRPRGPGGPCPEGNPLTCAQLAHHSSRFSWF